MDVYTAPERVPHIKLAVSKAQSVFLAGSIEMDTAEKWQDKVIKALENSDVTVFNPRREQWDASWKQEKSNPQFSEQVNWELNHLDEASIKFFYFDKNTKSPITLAELGFVLAQKAYAPEHHVIVVCPEGFWRRGNVDIMCDRAGVNILETLQEGIDELLILL